MVFGNRDKERSSTSYNPDTGMAHTTRSVKGRKSRPSINFLIASLLTVAGAVLLWLAGFSAVFINSIYYIIMRDRVGDRLGTFGYCVTRGEVFGCSKSQVGYNYPLIPSSKGLTGALILTPIAAGLASLAFFALIFGIIRRRGGFLPFFLTLLAALVALVSFILALVAFVTFHRRASRNNLDPKYGSALWLHLAGTACLLLAIHFTLLGWIRQRKASRSTESTLYPVAPAPVPVHETTYVEPTTGPTTYRAPSPQHVVAAPVVAPVINRSPTQPRTVVPIVREDTYVDSTPVNTTVYPTVPTTNSYNNGAGYTNGSYNNGAGYTNSSYNNGGAYNNNNNAYSNNAYSNTEPSRSYSPATSPVGGRRNVPLASPINPLSTHVDVTHPSYAQNPTYRA